MNKIIASALALSLLAGSAHCANQTPDQLSVSTTPNNSDLFLLYPVGGPMKAIQWANVKTASQVGLAAFYLQINNNLSDLSSAVTARNNLGLGSAATAGVGTTGHLLPYLDGLNVWSGTQNFAASTVTLASSAITSALGYTPANKAGDTFTGGVTVNATTTINGAASTYRNLAFATSGSTRWALSASGDPESGGNIGSNYQIFRYNDAGTAIDIPFVITRSSGLVSLADGLNVGSGLTASALSVTGSGTVGGTLSVTGAASASALTTGTLTAGAVSTGSMTASGAASSASLTVSGAASVGTTLTTANLTVTAASTVPTQSPGDNTTSIATTAFVTAAVAAAPTPTVAEFRNQQTNGTNSGETLASTTWAQRTLNTTVINTISGASLSSNRVTLPAGTYQVTVAASAYPNAGQAQFRHRIRNITDSTTIALGSIASQFTGSIVSGQATLTGAFTLAAAKVVEIDTYCTAASTGGTALTSGEPEVYADVTFVKVG